MAPKTLKDWLQVPVKDQWYMKPPETTVEPVVPLEPTVPAVVALETTVPAEVVRLVKSVIIMFSTISNH